MSNVDITITVVRRQFGVEITVSGPTVQSVQKAYNEAVTVFGGLSGYRSKRTKDRTDEE